ncbi:membrane protein [Saccharothrix sp. ST-888]|nr:membrane protein [Saccharothrix sp. ST-888]
MVRSGGVSVFLIVGLVMYFVPTVIAFLRGTRNKGAVLVVNLFLGWTFIGWVVALAMSFGGARSQG